MGGIEGQTLSSKDLNIKPPEFGPKKPPSETKTPPVNTSKPEPEPAKTAEQAAAEEAKETPKTEDPPAGNTDKEEPKAKAETKPPETKFGSAMWKDQPVEVIGPAGRGPDGRDYVYIKSDGDGGKTGIPLDEIQFPESASASEEGGAQAGGSAKSTAGANSADSGKTEEAATGTPNSASAEKKPPTESEQRQEKMKKNKEALDAGWELLNEKVKAGFFDTNDRVDVKNDALKYLDQTKNGALDGDGLRAFFNAIHSVGGEEVIKIEKAAAENLKVVVGGQRLTFEEWRGQIKTIKDLPAEMQNDAEMKQKLQELEGGEFGYDFSPEKVKTSEERMAEADELIDKKLKELETKNPRTEDDEKLLVWLRLSQATEEGRIEKGDLDLRVIIKDKALRQLAALDKTSGAEKIIDDMREDVIAARADLNKHLGLIGWDRDRIIRFNQGLDSGDVSAFAGVQEIPGLKKAFFGLNAKGEEITDEKIRKILDPKEEKKGMNIILLLLLALGSELKQALPPTQ